MKLTSEEIQYFDEQIRPLLSLPKIKQMSQYTQHGHTSCLEHCLTVAYYSYLFAIHFNLHVDLASLIRGCLLHDYFLYDWHDQSNHISFHGFKHPGIALKNASSDFELSTIEKDMISHHMFPLTPTPPHSKEALLVCLVDKWCSLKETFHSPSQIDLISNYSAYCIS